jgi:hypothetical protein
LEAIAMKMRELLVPVLALALLWSGAPSVVAHNIDVVKARDKAREYARQKVADPNRAYEHYTTDCLAAFPGHNHYVRCSIFYQDENRVQLCKERIEVYLQPHRKTMTTNLYDPTMFIKNTSAKEC